jgi:autotransporter translocation and assembly factor TamB
MALCGCGGGGVGSLLVDPGQYDAFHCKDLVQVWGTFNAREQTLRSLTAKASEATGGAVIGALTYRTELETIAAQRKLVQQEAAEKKCELGTTYQSDQGVR